MSKHQIKRKTLAILLAVVLACSTSAFLGYDFAKGQSSPSLPTLTLNAGPYPGAPNFTIFTDGVGDYYAKDAYGSIDYSSTILDTVISDSVNAGNGTVLLNNLPFDGTVVIPVGVLLESNYGGNLYYYNNTGQISLVGPRGVAGTNGTNGTNGVAGPAGAVLVVPSSYDYTVYENATATYLENNQAVILGQSTDFATVANWAEGNLTSGNILLAPSSSATIMNSINQKGGVAYWGEGVGHPLSLGANVPMFLSVGTGNLKMGLYNIYMTANNRTECLVDWSGSIQSKIIGCWLYDDSGTYIYDTGTGTSYSNWIDHNEISASYGGATLSVNSTCAGISDSGDTMITYNEIDFGSEAGGLSIGILDNGAGDLIQGNHIVQTVIGIRELAGFTWVMQNYLDSMIQSGVSLGGSVNGVMVEQNGFLDNSYGSSSFNAIDASSSTVNHCSFNNNMFAGGTPQYCIDLYCSGTNCTIAFNQDINWANAGNYGDGINVYSGQTGTIVYGNN